MSVEVDGHNGLALLDTGASLSVIDKALARKLELPSPGAMEWAGVNAHGERSVAALRTTHIRVAGHRQLFTLDMVEVPGIRETVPGLNVLMLLGWDFLGACTLVCNGPSGMFELTLPPPVRTPRRRRF
jgi:predicted aspartyl protease